MKQKAIEATACILFILSLFTLCGIEYYTLTAQVIGLVTGTIELFISAILFNIYYKDGRWK